MFRRAEVVSSRAPAEAAAGVPLPRPNLSGDLGTLLHAGPDFRICRRGYDRLQVDNYVDWAEIQMVAMRRAHEQLLNRFGVCSAELEISRRLLARSPKGLELLPISERVEEILRLAADEASEVTAAGAAEGERILADARLEADARLRKAHDIKEAAVAVSDQLREQAEREREEAAELLARARRQANEIVRDAAVERDRLTEEATEARARLAAVQEEVDDLRRQRDEARDLLRRLTERIGQALEAVTASVPNERIVLAENVAQLT